MTDRNSPEYWRNLLRVVQSERDKLREENVLLKRLLQRTLDPLNTTMAGIELVPEIEELLGERCEGCREPATRHDSEGVPLCSGCIKELLDDALRQKGVIDL